MKLINSDCLGGEGNSPRKSLPVPVGWLMKKFSFLFLTSEVYEFFRRVRLIPMKRDVLAGAKPDTIVLARVVEKFHQANRFRWPTDEAVVQRHSHDLWNSAPSS